MKPITINVSTPVYQQFKIYAKRRGRKVSELVREAMEQFLRSRIENKPSVKNFRPFSLKLKQGSTLFGDNLFEEMLKND